MEQGTDMIRHSCHQSHQALAALTPNRNPARTKERCIRGKGEHVSAPLTANVAYLRLDISDLILISSSGTADLQAHCCAIHRHTAVIKTRTLL